MDESVTEASKLPGGFFAAKWYLLSSCSWIPVGEVPDQHRGIGRIFAERQGLWHDEQVRYTKYK